MDWSEQQAKFGALIQPRGIMVQPTASRTGKKRGRGGFVTSLISEAAGSGGALGGAAAGAAIGSVVPVIGTTIGGVIGAGLGGFLGGTGGRLAENKVRDDEYRMGDALKEGAISGAFGAAGQGFQAIRGAKALSAADEALKGGATGVTKLGKNARLANKLTSSGSGLKVGKNVGDINELDEVAGLFQKHKIIGTPTTQLRKIDTTMSKLDTVVDDMLAKKPIPVYKGVAVKISQMVDDPMQFTDISLSEKGRVFLQNYIDDAGKFTDARQLNKLVQRLNPTARRAYNKSLAGTALTPKEEAAFAFKQAADDVLQEIAPAIRSTKKEMALLFKYNPQVAQFSQKGLNAPFLGKMTQGIAAPLRAAQTQAGSALSGIGNFAASPTLRGATRLAGGMATRGIANKAMSPPQTLEDAIMENYSMKNPMMPSMTNPMMEMTNIPASISNMSSDYAQDASMSSMGIPRDSILEAMIIDISETGGKNLDKIKMLYDFANPETNKKPMTQGQQERQDLINAIGLTEGAVNAGSINYGPIGSRIEGLKSWVNAADPETLSFKNTVSGLRAAITKARAGSSLTAGELKLLEKYTPSDTDTEQVVRSKLAALRQLYGYGTPEISEPASLEDALMQYAR